jgi:hypothetical protein
VTKNNRAGVAAGPSVTKMCTRWTNELYVRENKKFAVSQKNRENQVNKSGRFLFRKLILFDYKTTTHFLCMYYVPSNTQRQEDGP